MFEVLAVVVDEDTLGLLGPDGLIKPLASKKCYSTLLLVPFKANSSHYRRATVQDFKDYGVEYNVDYNAAD